MTKVTSYSALNIAATLDGLPVQGLSDGDNAIQIDQNAALGTGLVGIQGDGIFSGTADKSATIILRLQHASPTHRQLLQKMRAQQAGRLVGFPFDLIDTGSNEGGNGDGCFIAVAPSTTKGDAATVREWTIWCGDWTTSITNA